MSEKNWKFQFGLSAGNPTPIAINSGIRYKAIAFHLQGMGFRNRANDYWTNIRGGFTWKFFRELPFNFDLGIGGGYSFAKAPNGYHSALNKANHTKYVLPYNYEETLDLSPEFFIHLYGIFTQISAPIHIFLGNKKPTILWRVGYMFEI